MTFLVTGVIGGDDDQSSCQLSLTCLRVERFSKTIIVLPDFEDRVWNYILSP